MTAVDSSDKSFEFSYDAEESTYTQTPTSLKPSQTYTPVSHTNCRQNLRVKQLHITSCASLQPPGPMPLWPQRRIGPRPLRNFTTLPLIHTTLPRRPLDLTFLASPTNHNLTNARPYPMHHSSWPAIRAANTNTSTLAHITSCTYNTQHMLTSHSPQTPDMRNTSYPRISAHVQDPFWRNISPRNPYGET